MNDARMIFSMTIVLRQVGIVYPVPICCESKLYRIRIYSYILPFNERRAHLNIKFTE